MTVDMIDLGCANSCETIDTGMTADVAGTYYIRASFSGQKKMFSFDLLIGEKIEFSASHLNEDYTHRFSITPPDLSIIDSSEIYKITIKPKI